MARRIERFYIPGPAGRLEALIEEPEGGLPRYAALVCHPHPGRGGTMHNKVVYRLARGLRESGAVTLRFNFRGVHLSEGSYDHGRGEVHDARAALVCLIDKYPALPVTVAGFSFGSRVAVQCWQGARAILLVGFPVVLGELGVLDWCPLTRVFIQSTNDEYAPQIELQNKYNRLWGPKRIYWIEAEDHFFRGALDTFEAVVAGVGRTLNPPA